MSSDTLYLRDPDTGVELRFDAVIAYTATRTYRVSQHPVERGVDVADHVQQLPVILSAQVLVTETPWTGSRPDGLAGVALINRVLALLQSMAGKRLQVVTHRLGVFPSMALTRVPIPVDKVRALSINLELQEIRVATATLVEVPVEEVVTTDPGTATDPAADFAQDAQAAAAGLPSEVDAGQQPTTDMGSTSGTNTTTTPPSATVEQDTSAAYDMASWLGVV